MASFFSMFSVKIGALPLVLSSFSMTVLLALTSMVFFFSSEKKLIPSSSSFFTSLIFVKLTGEMKENTGFMNKGMKNEMYPLFFIILCINILGLIPFMLTPTSLVMLAGTLSLGVVVGATLLSMHMQKMNFLANMTPFGCPILLAPFFVVMETASQFMKIMSLGVSLAANMTAGHLLMVILGSFFLKSLSMGYLMPGSISKGMMLYSMMFLMMVLEMCVAFIQSYVFCLLVSMYVGETKGH